jgi:hypothetical protein
MHHPDQTPQALVSESGGLGTMASDVDLCRSVVRINDSVPLAQDGIFSASENAKRNKKKVLLDEATMTTVLLDIFDEKAKPYGKSQKVKHAHWKTKYDDLPDLPTCRLMRPLKKPHKQAPTRPCRLRSTLLRWLRDT